MGGYTEQGGGVQPGSVWMPLPGSLLGARYFVTLFLPSRVGVLALAAKSTLVARRAGRVRSVRWAPYPPSGPVGRRHLPNCVGEGEEAPLDQQAEAGHLGSLIDS